MLESNSIIDIGSSDDEVLDWIEWDSLIYETINNDLSDFMNYCDSIWWIFRSNICILNNKTCNKNNYDVW
jgi:hypothetical protein